MRRLTILILSFFNVLIFTTSCQDFFDQESDFVLYADEDHLNNAVDTVYSMTGIIKKLQVIADRTILFGEVRGDLVTLTADANKDLLDVANFNVSDQNRYNNPRDYYAIINNCNYFIAHADTALRSTREEPIFMKEYAAVKGIRAWVYLQLVLNYGRVPLVLEPIVNNKEEAERIEREAKWVGLGDVCAYFINDLQDVPTTYWFSFPGYRDIRNTQSSHFYFPIPVLLGDMYLWMGSLTGNRAMYRNAALAYYIYIYDRNLYNNVVTSYPAGINYRTWESGKWETPFDNFYKSQLFRDETRASDSELITMIPGDSIRAEGSYSELRNLFNSTSENNYKFSITASQALKDLSASQHHCVLTFTDGKATASYAPTTLTEMRAGDLRLYSVLSQGHVYNTVSGSMSDYQTNQKYQTRNVHIYRKQMVYLRLAEALNMSGFPHLAFDILSTGLTQEEVDTVKARHCSDADTAFVNRFKFPTDKFRSAYYNKLTTTQINSKLNGQYKTYGGQSTEDQYPNTVGIHTHGSGWTPLNDYYQMPNDTTIKDSLTLVAYQMAQVDSLILNEDALELAFEGTRFYDLMRFAMRRTSPGDFMAKYVYARRGEANRGTVEGEIKQSLRNPNNWYLKWTGLKEPEKTE